MGGGKNPARVGACRGTGGAGGGTAGAGARGGSGGSGGGILGLSMFLKENGCDDDVGEWLGSNPFRGIGWRRGEEVWSGRSG